LEKALTRNLTLRQSSSTFWAWGVSRARRRALGLEIGFERRKKVWVLVVLAGLLAGDLYVHRGFVRHRDAPYTF
jgi:hypothetical protein